MDTLFPFLQKDPFVLFKYAVCGGIFGSRASNLIEKKETKVVLITYPKHMYMNFFGMVVLKIFTGLEGPSHTTAAYLKAQPKCYQA